MINSRTDYRSAFTIVELLIVIVVIAVLASLTVVSYNGIRDRADEASVRVDLTNNRKKLLEYKAANGQFPEPSSALGNGYSCQDAFGVEPGEVDSSGNYCPIVGNGALAGYGGSSPGSDQFYLFIGKGRWAYSIDHTGEVTKEECTLAADYSSSGGSKEYTCPSGIGYSQ
ncbi:prepilin-type N-terminal cleavage/methylation domain-containing protein [Candidatus Nomurabacteria bacterium]|nr:prepilin-type N-terminal cleavage/methylation domain-containing protein [Candidatus Nomurabacteria bacterium]